MNTFRKILLPLTEAPSGRAALQTSLALAASWHAHLEAVVVAIDSRDVAPLAGDGLSGAMLEDMMAATAAENQARSAALHAAFRHATAAAGVPVGNARLDGASASIEMATGRVDELIPAMARLADLTILPHAGPTPDAVTTDCLHAVLFDSGRPVLIAPGEPMAALGRRCCVAWNGTAESSAALWAMLPFLKAAEAVRILHAGDYQRRGPVAASVVPYLALHGVAADVVEFKPVDRDVGAGLLAAATAFGADLLGMGAYSHSRLRQLILGGVTRHVLEHAALPVLMCR